MNDNFPEMHAVALFSECEFREPLVLRDTLDIDDIVHAESRSFRGTSVSNLHATHSAPLHQVICPVWMSSLLTSSVQLSRLSRVLSVTVKLIKVEIFYDWKDTSAVTMWSSSEVMVSRTRCMANGATAVC